VENTLELLDHPGEFFVDVPGKQLYFYPRSDAENPKLHAELAVELSSDLVSLVRMVGADRIAISNM
jgi:hypothetical protein